MKYRGENIDLTKHTVPITVAICMTIFTVSVVLTIMSMKDDIIDRFDRRIDPLENTVNSVKTALENAPFNLKITYGPRL